MLSLIGWLTPQYAHLTIISGVGTVEERCPPVRERKALRNIHKTTKNNTIRNKFLMMPRPFYMVAKA